MVWHAALPPYRPPIMTCPPADAGLAPAGILEVPAQQMDIAFGTSRDTSDVSADALEWRRTSRRDG